MGWTSHDVVAKARRITGQRRIGHTGTLDPMASGLLVLCLGRATRLVEFLTGHDKTYAGVITLGRTTTTDDAEGETVAERASPTLGPGELERVLQQFHGTIEQRPPAYSALKVGGRRAYAVARAGGEPELRSRTVAIHDLAAEQLGRDTIGVALRCSAGTYVRSLARDLGEALGCGGHLSALRRYQAGPFIVQDAITPEALEAASPEELLDLVIPSDEGILSVEAALVGAEAASVLANGGAWRTSAPPLRDAQPARIYSEGGDFLGVGSVSTFGEIRVSRLFWRNNSSQT
jgi:tRNA pseudouridine55 synthase